jgi:nucleoside-diphosphate-sugar epimerase
VRAVGPEQRRRPSIPGPEHLLEDDRPARRLAVPGLAIASRVLLLSPRLTWEHRWAALVHRAEQFTVAQWVAAQPMAGADSRVVATVAAAVAAVAVTARQLLLVNAVAQVGVEVIGDLIQGDGILFQFAIPIRGLGQRAHFHPLRVALVELLSFHQAKDYQALMR